MKKLFAAAVSALALCLNAAEVPNDSFVPIPADPGFAFARSLNPRTRESGEASPIRQAYCIGKYPVTNAEYQTFCKAIRGGSWYANAGSCKTNYRGEGRRPSGAYSTVGFRLAAEKN